MPVGMTKSHRWGLLALLLFLLFCVTGLNVLLSYAGDLALFARLHASRANIAYRIADALVLDESKHWVHWRCFARLTMFWCHICKQFASTSASFGFLKVVGFLLKLSPKEMTYSHR